MRAVDTNGVVRLVAKDEPEQFRRAYELFQGGGILIPLTVVLETEWVLRSAYRAERK